MKYALMLLAWGQGFRFMRKKRWGEALYWLGTAVYWLLVAFEVEP